MRSNSRVTVGEACEAGVLVVCSNNVANRGAVETQKDLKSALSEVATSDRAPDTKNKLSRTSAKNSAWPFTWLKSAPVSLR